MDEVGLIAEINGENPPIADVCKVALQSLSLVENDEVKMKPHAAAVSPFYLIVKF